jgi:catechol 2,3-dioxygenase-like lactoylglutathione lyase family enzyme
MEENNLAEKQNALKHELFKDFVQIGCIVADLDQAIRYLTEVFGIGPFRVIDWPPEGREDLQRFYHGEPGQFSARMAFTELGPVELELIQPIQGQSIWQDFLDERGGGIHHIRFNINDIDTVRDYLAGFGIEAAQFGSGIRPGTTWMNFATEDKLGFGIEVMKVVPGTTGRTPKIVDGQVVD